MTTGSDQARTGPVRYAGTEGSSNPLMASMLLNNAYQRIRPIIRAERRGREIGGVKQIASIGEIVPRIPHGHRRGHLIAADDDAVAINLRIGIDKFLIGPGDLKPLERAALGD